MRFENEGMTLWYGMSDSPAPEGAVHVGADITVTIAVKPADASNKVELLYHRDQGTLETVTAQWLRHDISNNAQYFKARFPVFRVGDTVEYTAVCYCAGRQVPSHSEAQQLASSFHVVASETKPIASLTVAMPMLTAEEASGPDTSAMPPVNIVPQHVPSSEEPLPHPAPDMPRPDGTTKDKPILSRAEAQEGMNVAKLNAGDSGDDVARLHEALRRHGFAVPAEEAKRKFFGPATREAVTDCQKQHGFEVTGAVDAATAAALSDITPASHHASLPGASPVGLGSPFNPDRDIKQVIFDAPQAQQINTEIAQEADARMSDLERSGVFTDPTSVNLSLQDHPFLQQEFQQAAVFKLATVAGLPDTKIEKLLARSVNIDAISDETLATLVKEDALQPKEAQALGLSASLYHLVDEHLELVTALQQSKFTAVPGDQITQVSDLVALSRDEWLKVVEGVNIQPPAGIDQVTYAAQLNNKVTALFPTDALLSRVLPRSTDNVAPALDQLSPLFERNPAVFGHPFESLHTDGLSANELSFLLSTHSQLQRLANLHPGLALTALLNAPSSPTEKATAISDRLALIERVHKLNPTTEFLVLDYSPESPDIAELQFQDLSTEQQHMVLSDFKAYQRAFALTNDVSHAQALLEAGYHSALTIARSKLDVFQKDTSLSQGAAKKYHRAARSTVAEIASAAISAFDALQGGFTQLAVSNLEPDVQEYLKKFAGFADFFGSQDYCQCEHCQSILSPSAYFVDLMSFVEEHVLDVFFKNAKSNHELNLKVRRPDLWTLSLNCENTDTVIPYLDIINEILENFIAQRQGFTGDLLDRAAVEEAVYLQALSNSDASFQLPFLLPLAQLDTYLAHFDRSRALIARTLTALPALVVAVLRISQHEYTLITQANNDLSFLRNLYGIQFGTQVIQVDGIIARFITIIIDFNVHEMLTFTGLTRAELGQLCITSIVSNFGSEPINIQSEKTSSDSVQNDIERIHGLTPDALDRLHRFTRLWRRVPWSILELDLVLAHLVVEKLISGIDQEGLMYLVAILALHDRWNLPVEQNCTLWSSIPQTPGISSNESLFDRLFNLPPFVLLDGRFPQDSIKFIHPSFRQAGIPSPANNTLHRLLAGLQVNDEQLAQLIAQLSVPLGVNLATNNEDDRNFLLTIFNLTLLYRHALLAQLLKLSILDLFQLIRLAGITSAYIADLDDLSTLLEFYDWWKSSGFKLDDLGFITHSLIQQPAAYPGGQAMAAEIISSVQAEKALLFADTLFAFLPGVTEEQSRSIIAANTAIIQTSLNSSIFYLDSAFNPATTLNIPSDIKVSEPDARNALLTYHVSRVLPSLISGHLKLSVDKASCLIAMSGVSLSDPALAQALQGGPLKQLTDLLAQLILLSTLFRNNVFDPTALDFIRTHKDIFVIADFNSISIASIRKLSFYIVLTDTANQADFTPLTPAVDPHTVQQVLASFDPTQKFANTNKDVLATVLGINSSLVSTLLPNVTLPATAPEALALLIHCTELVQYLGVGADTLNLIISSDYHDLTRAGEAILSAFRAKYADEKEFLEKLQPFDDTIRSLKRDALSNYLIRSAYPTFATLDDLYEYFLVDVQLDGCARTSRVVAAISSVQLYVHRCLMNLEQDRRALDDPNHLHIRPDSIPVSEWSWRKNYRVWEANRKVFLFPENYTEPELRDDKTPLFRDLESTLLQQQINEQNVLDAYVSYLNSFEEIARLKIAGTYQDIHQESKTDLLHLFGVTPSDPPIYYYRTIENALYSEIERDRGIIYSPWRKIDVQIPVRKVSPIVHLGRLFVFWVEIVSTSKNKVQGGNSDFIGYKHKLALKYTTLRLDGSWTAPQSISLPGLQSASTSGLHREADDGVVDDPLDGQKIPRYSNDPHLEPKDSYTLTGFQWEQFYPENEIDNPDYPELTITGCNFATNSGIDFYRKSINHYSLVMNTFDKTFYKVLSAKLDGSGRHLFSFESIICSPGRTVEWYPLRSIIADEVRLSAAIATIFKATGQQFIFSPSEKIADLLLPVDIAVINGVGNLNLFDAIIDSNGDLLLLQGSVRWGLDYLLKRLGTTLGEQLTRKLFSGGVNALLDIDTQKSLGEAELPISLTNHIQNASAIGSIDFKGSLGTYYREIFFHIPFLIANQLNSQQRFTAAQSWYHYIFNPTAAAESTAAPSSSSSVWRYLEFRNLNVPKLRDALTDPVAIAAYKKDPFNPHAIARLRLSAYQKSIVMKYIDNLLDWGDSLFFQFTTESVNEAMLLYVMASDILGPRPASLGDCGVGKVSPRNYATIAPLLKKGSDFLIEIETLLGQQTSTAKSRSKKKLKAEYVVNSTYTNFYAAGALATARLDASPTQDVGATSSTETAMLQAEDGIARPYEWKQTSISSWTTEKDRPKRILSNNSPLILDYDKVPEFSYSIIRQVNPVFCIPENKDLSQYWDRVESRLYNIRHCMDITGVSRQLALFAPEIDPRLLVRARAAGLSIEDVLNATSGNLPPYRFSYLIEKAKQYAASVQSFGNALLSALEKRDLEELNRLHTVQQQNLLKLTTRTRELDINIASDTITSLERQQTTIQYRKDYYQGLIDNDLTPWERGQQVARHIATISTNLAVLPSIVAGVGYLVPQAGSPFAMKYGGVEIGNSATAWSRVASGMASAMESISASAGLEAGFDRRREDWQHQIQLADHELKQVEKQLTAAQLHKEIAVRSLDLHQKSIEQQEEIFSFYNDRFTNLGLYTWLSTTLQRIYREAYTGAYEMARLAEQAFRFERGDDTGFLLQPDYWEATKAGLLAGDRLVVDLQNMERRFIETNYRTLEINQSFSLTQINPAALVLLRETATCDFDIPEVFFDLFYPGQYRRKIKSVRLTIPCITGPYINVGATLTLTASSVRNEPRLGNAQLIEVPRRRSVSVAASSAQNDAGVFEFSFRDERYMPFEGAGAISSWKLSLPNGFRQFDYQTINDVILHISYTAEEDGLFRQKVEQEQGKIEGTILNYLSTHPLARALSLRQDFSSAFNRLLHSPANTPVKLQITEKYLPLFLSTRNLKVTKALLVLKTPKKQTVNKFQISINGTRYATFERYSHMGNLWAKDLGELFATGFLGEHTLIITQPGDLALKELSSTDSSALDANKLMDCILYLEYQVQGV